MEISTAAHPVSEQMTVSIQIFLFVFLFSKRRFCGPREEEICFC